MSKAEEAEIAHLEAERVRAIAEAEKIRKETDHLEKELRQRWYSARLLVQSAIGGVVGAALMAAWAIGYLQPIMQKDNLIAAKENQIAKLQLEYERAEAKKREEALKRDAAITKRSLSELSSQNRQIERRLESDSIALAALRTRFEEQAAELDRLSQDAPAESERALTRLANESQANAGQIGGVLEALEAERQLAGERSKALGDSLAVASLREAVFKVLDRSDGGSSYFLRLRSDGFAGYNFDGPSNFAFDVEPAVWAFQDGSLSIKWAHGDVQTYAISNVAENEFVGTTQDGETQRIVRIRNVVTGAR